MADPSVTDGIGDALLDLVRQAATDAPRHIERAVEWLRENAHPPEGVRLISPDGTLFTGVAIIDRNDVVVLVAARQQGPSVPRPAIPMPASSPAYASPNRHMFDDPSDGWPNDPYRR